MGIEEINGVRIKIKALSNDDSVWKILDLQNKIHKHYHILNKK
jgi:hypothetical protein